MVPSPINLFGFQLLQDLQTEPGQNVVISPPSIHQALTMAAFGARGEALEGLLNLTHTSSTAEMAELGEALRADTGDVMTIANSVWAHVLNTDYVYEVRDKLNADVFAEIPKKDPINDWIADKTHGLITDALSEDPWPTGATLVNAVHFKDSWKFLFDKSHSAPASFSHRDGPKTVHMMEAESPYGEYEGFDYFENGKVQVAALDYSNKAIDALVVLPKEGVHMGEVSAEDFEEWTRGLEANQEGKLYFPKLDLEFGVVELAEELAKRGLVLQGDYGKMREGIVAVNSVMHKAVIKVDEEGTEAAAVTAVDMADGISDEPSFYMYCDRPFMFIVRHKRTNTALFVAKVEDPQPGN